MQGGRSDPTETPCRGLPADGPCQQERWPPTNRVIHYSHRLEQEEARPLSLDCFNKIKSAKAIRQTQSNPALRLDEICSRIPSLYDPDIQSQHRWCYASFTSVSRLIVPISTSTTGEGDDCADSSSGFRASRHCSASASYDSHYFHRTSVFSAVKIEKPREEYGNR